MIIFYGHLLIMLILLPFILSDIIKRIITNNVFARPEFAFENTRKLLVYIGSLVCVIIWPVYYFSKFLRFMLKREDGLHR